MKKIKMESQNKYLGDDKFKKFLEHYSCPTPLEIIKLRFAGSICSPNLELRPTDVISLFLGSPANLPAGNQRRSRFVFQIFHGTVGRNVSTS